MPADTPPGSPDRSFPPVGPPPAVGQLIGFPQGMPQGTDTGYATGTIKRDASSPAPKVSGFLNSTTGTQASNTFSPPAGSVLVVTCSGCNRDGASGSWDAPIITNTNGSLNWTQIHSGGESHDPGNGVVFVWWAPCPTPLTNVVVSCTIQFSAQNVGEMGVAVDVWTGVNGQLPNPTIGAVTAGFLPNGSTNVSGFITPTYSGSALVMSACDGGFTAGAAGATMKPGSGAFLADTFGPGGSNAYVGAVGYWGTAQGAYATEAGAGQSLQVTPTSSTLSYTLWIAYELVAGPPPLPDTSVPLNDPPAVQLLPPIGPPAITAELMGLPPMVLDFGGAPPLRSPDQSVALGDPINMGLPPLGPPPVVAGLMGLPPFIGDVPVAAGGSVSIPGVTSTVIFAAPAGNFTTDSFAVGVTATITFAAPSGQVDLTDPGTTATITFAAPAGLVSVSDPGTTATVTFAAPAGTASVTDPGATSTITFAAPAGNFTTGGGVSIAGTTTTITFAAPAGLVDVTDPGATATVTFAAPTGAASVTIPGPTATITFAAASGLVAVTDPGAPSTITFAAPAGNFTVGAGVTGTTTTITFAAPSGLAAVTLPGTTSTVTFAAPTGGFATSFSAAGVTTGFTVAAIAGKASVGINGPAGTVTFSSPAGTIAVTCLGTTATITFAAPAPLPPFDVGFLTAGTAPQTSLTVSGSPQTAVTAGTAPETTATATDASQTIRTTHDAAETSETEGDR